MVAEAILGLILGPIVELFLGHHGARIVSWFRTQLEKQPAEFPSSLCEVSYAAEFIRNQVFEGAFPVSAAVTASVGGEPAQVLFAGLTSPGLYLAIHERKHNSEALSNQITAGQFFIWENKNRDPVSVARWIPITDNGMRVGSVYTPKELRGNRYASACVAHLKQWLLTRGRTWCSLFADVANPQANAIYQRIGFRPRFSYCEYRF
jgi:GNAT superfamily N-acetyltransferase